MTIVHKLIRPFAGLYATAITAGTGQFAVIQPVAPSRGVEVLPINMRDAAEIERAVAAFARSSNGGLIVTAGWLRGRELIPGHGVASQHLRLPTGDQLYCRQAVSIAVEKAHRRVESPDGYTGAVPPCENF